MRKTIAGLLVACVGIFILPVAHAQTKEQTITRLVTMSANGVLDSMITTLSARNEDFNTHIEAINKTRPLEVKNLDSVHVAENVGKTLQFIEYLKKYRATGKTIIERFEDSLFVLEGEYPPVPEKKLIKSVATSYIADNKAFDVYVAALSKIYSQVLDVLLYLQHTQYEIVKDVPQFHSTGDAAEYRKLIAKLDGSQKEAKDAGAASRKASDRAHKKLQEFNTAASHNTSK